MAFLFVPKTALPYTLLIKLTCPTIKTWGCFDAQHGDVLV